MNRNHRTLSCLTKELSNPNYSPVDMKVNHLLNMCLLQLAECFVNKGNNKITELAIPKIFVSSLFTPVKKRNSLCSGKHVK